MKRITKAAIGREVKRIVAGFVGFIYWTSAWCFIEDKATHRPILFKLFPCQKEFSNWLLKGEWLCLLKARRLGFTWLLAAYAVWRVLYFRMFTVTVISQDAEYAEDFLDKCRFIIDHLPAWLKRTPTRDNKKRLEFNYKNHGSWIRSFASTKSALRSLAADLVIVDEAAYVKLLKKIVSSGEPTLETGNGQFVLLSTSDGPFGYFQLLWKLARSGKKKYRSVFYGWDARPERDEAWYQKEAGQHEDDPLYMKREYPRTPEECFESAEGRVYALFSDTPKFVRKVTLHDEWPRYRAIDFGGVDPFVCLWIAEIPGERPGLTVDPSCMNTIGEFLAYSYGSDGEPADEYNHCMDGLRYAITSLGKNGLRGRIHIYNELYVPDSARKGLALPDLARRIIERTGVQKIRQTVADRSRPDSITLLCQMNVPCIPQRQMRGGNKGEIAQGVDKVRALIAGTAKGPSAEPLPQQRSGPKLPPGGIQLEGRPQKRSLTSIFRRHFSQRPVLA
jgi:hypothetical protein